MLVWTTSINPPDDSVFFNTRPKRYSGLVGDVVRRRQYVRYMCLHVFHSCLFDANKHILNQMDLWRIEGGVMWRTHIGSRTKRLYTCECRKIRSIGATCHRENGQICTVGNRYLPLSPAIHREEKRRVFDSPDFPSEVPLFVPLPPRYISRKETSRPWQWVNTATTPASVLGSGLCSHRRFASKKNSE